MSIQIILVGHPRFGSGYISKLFRSMGIDIGYYKYGKDGVSSWLLAPPENIFNKRMLLEKINTFHLFEPLDLNYYVM